MDGWRAHAIGDDGEEMQRKTGCANGERTWVVEVVVPQVVLEAYSLVLLGHAGPEAPLHHAGEGRAAAASRVRKLGKSLGVRAREMRRVQQAIVHIGLRGVRGPAEVHRLQGALLRHVSARAGFLRQWRRLRNGPQIRLYRYLLHRSRMQMRVLQFQISCIDGLGA